MIEQRSISNTMRWPASARITLGSAAVALALICGPGYAAAADGAAAPQTHTDSSPPRADANPEDFSKANRLLFMTDHLSNVDAPSKLEYSISRKGDSNNSFEDKIDLTVAAGQDQAKQVHIDFMSGDRNRYVPDINNAHGNPVIMMFLQNDVIETAQRTGGSWRYFQRQIKFALEQDAQVKSETAEYKGKSIDVKRVYIEPYSAEKAHREDLAGEVNKQYVFTLSEAVPGGVLEIRTETPASGDRQQEIVERLALQSVDSDAAPAQHDGPNA